MRFIKFNYIKLFNTALFFTLFLLLTVQLVLTVPGLKNLFYEMGIGESLYTSAGIKEPYLGEITLELEGAEPDGKIVVLQNGEPVAAFFQKQIKINVPDNTVVEIDGTAYDKAFSVNIINFSEHIKNNTVKKIDIDKNIVILDRYFLK